MTCAGMIDQAPTPSTDEVRRPMVDTVQAKVAGQVNDRPLPGCFGPMRNRLYSLSMNPRLSYWGKKADAPFLLSLVVAMVMGFPRF